MLIEHLFILAIDYFLILRSILIICSITLCAVRAFAVGTKAESTFRNEDCSTADKAWFVSATHTAAAVVCSSLYSDADLIFLLTAFDIEFTKLSCLNLGLKILPGSNFNRSSSERDVILCLFTR